MEEKIRTEVEGIRSDASSGAVALANRAALLLMEFCDASGPGGAEFEHELVALCRMLVGTQPAMAPLWNLCSAVLSAAERPGVIYVQGQPRPASAAQAASNAALRFYAFLAHHPRRIANELLPYVHSGALLLTHSSSATVLGALLRAHEAGKRFGVVCTESRPLFEGTTMARQLAAAGIGVEVIADAAAAVFIHGFYTLLIGADAILPGGVINKVGTLGMALAARSAGVPVYCLAGSEKLVPAGADITIEEKDPSEIVVAEPNLRGFNIYFDQTPLDLVTKFFSEEGLLTATQMRARLAEMTVHPALLPEAA